MGQQDGVRLLARKQSAQVVGVAPAQTTTTTTTTITTLGKLKIVKLF
jgi:hypothetical protein